MPNLWRRAGYSNLDRSQTGLLCANWGVSVTEGAARPTALTEGTPPLKIYSNGTIDLEFGPLLVVDYLVMDSSAFARIQRETRSPALLRLRESLRELHNEGFLRLIDYEPVLERHKQWILESSSEHASNPLRWTEGLRAAVAGWESARDRFRQVVDPSHYDMAMHIPFGIFAYLTDAGIELSEENYQQIRRMIFANRERVPRADREIMTLCLRPYLNHVFSCMAIRNEVELPLADWENLRPLYVPLHRQLGPTKPRADQVQDKVRELFECAIPMYEPASVTELMKLLKDKRIEVLREFVRVAVKEGHQFSHADVQRILREVHTVNMKKGQFGSRLNLTGFVAGVGLTALGLGPVPGMLAAAATSGIQEVAQRTASDFLEHELAWLYLLMESK
jgi:hypothetical protein